MKKSGLFVFLAVICGLILFSSACAEEGFTLPEGIRIIGEDAFAGTAIEEVTLPESVFLVEKGAFADAPNLEKIHVENPDKLFGRMGLSSSRQPMTIERPSRIPERPSIGMTGKPEQALPIQDNHTKKKKQETAEEDKNNRADEKTHEQDCIPNRARKTDEGVSLKPQERAEIHPIDCCFP